MNEKQLRNLWQIGLDSGSGRFADMEELKAEAYKRLTELFYTLEKIEVAAKEHDKGKAISMDEFSSQFEKKYKLKKKPF